MASVIDAAKYILEKTGEITSMKLQKLAYYSQAWALVWDEDEIFPEEFEAWANGPVNKCLYAKHRGMFKVNSSLFRDGDTSALSDAHKETIDKVLEFYGDKTAQWLSNLTHKEAPWLEARGDLEPMSSCSDIISKASMAEYYSSL
ncbi:Panacea domain-containing protein [Tatumella sp. UBA2305]|uniref:Panacea domain-containing protein n=1 Tax=Tatumella sp. UBA2305 TaxID=1947647 RepID=UPI0025FFDBEC|nr:type II toxin-antitoxin system antitoxin SocA domain-containing protein [Tatumella sp. UBA2305]